MPKHNHTMQAADAHAPVQAVRKKRRRSEEDLLATEQPTKRRKSSPLPEVQAEDTRGHWRCSIPKALCSSQLCVEGRESGPERGDDKDGHLNYQLGDNLTSRYKILTVLGMGTFGRVLECWDRVTGTYVAVKVVRNVQKYRDAAMIELEVLNTIGTHDPVGRHHCVRLLHWFDYRGHVCMVFNKLGPSLFDFLKRNEYKPFSVALVREFGRQVLEALAYLHDMHLIHTDLKPENILLRSEEYDRPKLPRTSRIGRRVPRSSAIAVIDFGSATFQEEYHCSVVSTRHYRAPEVILGLGWSYPCDMWSVGCILVELLTGDALFQTHENLEHLAMMQRVLGPIPEAMAARSDKNAAKFFRSSRLHWPAGASGKQSIKEVDKVVPLPELLRKRADISLRPYLNDVVDLLHKLLAYEPDDRPTAREALQHSFFTAAARTASPSRGVKAARSRSSSVEQTSNEQAEDDL